MDSSSVLLSIQNLVAEVKKEIFSNETSNFAAFVSTSAYDTAWLAMIPDHENKEVQQAGPMFKSCLDWVIENQREGGFWGEITDGEGSPTIDALPATLACLLALKTWNKGQRNVQLGLEFMNSKTEMLLKVNNSENLPRWFILTFPAMIELAVAADLHLVFPQRLTETLTDISLKRQQILEMEDLMDESRYVDRPLIAYLEALPSTYHFDRQRIVKQYLGSDGSLFRSPSATAHAFIATGNLNCMEYLHALLQKFPSGGVPEKYPVDEGMIKLSIVDHVQRLGLAEYFNQEIEQILAQIYENKKDCNSNASKTNINAVKLYEDALAFRLLRMQGHHVNPGSFCWFLHEAEMVAHMEENSEQFVSTMYSVYRATDLSFPGEDELEQARNFAIKMLQRSVYTRNRDHILFISMELQNMIKYELKQPWIARLDHLDHRKWIEENKISPLWIGKASFYRLSCLDNKNLMQLAVEYFEFQQSIYARESEELRRWSNKWKLSEMGFGREKTTYLYFATAASTCLPFNPIMRSVMAKAGIIVTVADDFYDTEGSLSELQVLTDAVKRWNSKGLDGHGKTIFDAVDSFVKDTAANCDPRHEKEVVAKLQDIWRETFKSWMVERRWSLAGYIPSMDAYLQTGMISIAAHTIVLPAASFLNPSSAGETLIKPVELHNITKLLMVITRLVNDTQSYQKEEVDGKMNLVSIQLNENPNVVNIQDSVDYVKGILEAKRKEFLEHVYMDDDMPKPWKQIHLSCMKVFQMFFNSGNLFDSETALLDDIDKAMYRPIDRKHSHLEPLIS
uniref:Putative terpene synthase 7 n=1 Tax=Eremophila drummondii TaxID=2652523 RepID=A0A6G9KV71_9LAMI|nr:putative terpene synthase 7 [Eremophila drummondii]